MTELEPVDVPWSQLPPAWPDDAPRLFCRTHGEPLRFDLLRLAWLCPSRNVCGTWVGVEVIAPRASVRSRP